MESVRHLELLFPCSVAIVQSNCARKRDISLPETRHINKIRSRRFDQGPSSGSFDSDSERSHFSCSSRWPLNNIHLMCALEGNSEFCFPESLCLKH